MATKRKGSQGDAAVSLKDAGNKLFAAGKFSEAAGLYWEAIGQLENSTAADPNFKAVCLSNISNCLFEGGDYDKSIEVAKTCLEELEKLGCSRGEKANDLSLKNQLRLARAHFYSFQTQDCIQILRELSTSQNVAYAKRATRMLQQVMQYTTTTTPKTPKALLKAPNRLSRVALQEPIVEYYRFGHNRSASALEEGPEFDNQRPEHKSAPLLLKDVQKLDILMAGINDGRHVLATIMDVLGQYQALPKDKQSNVDVKLVCNDINVASQAKFIVTLVILHKIGTLASTRADLKTNQAASRWCALLQYVLLSHAMPPWVKDLAVQAMEEVMAFRTHTAFQQMHPWLRCTSEQDWNQIIPVLSYWIAQLGGNDYQKHNPDWCDIPDVQDSLRNSFVLKEDLDKTVFDPNSTLNASQKAVIESRKEAAMSAKQEHIEKMKDIANWDPDALAHMRHILGPQATDDDIVNAYIGMVSESMTDVEDFDPKLSNRKTQLLIPGIQLAHSFLQSTKAILPPIDFCDDPNFAAIYKKDKGVCPPPRYETCSSMIHPEDLNKAKDVIQETWFANPFMFDPLWHSFAPNSEQHFSPILDFMVDYTMSEYGADTIDADTMMRAVDSNMDIAQGAQSDPDLIEFFDWTSCFFWNAGHALVALCEDAKVLQLEWNVGDIISICQAYNQAGNQRFHRILLSNIPDYTGMLSVFTDVIPLLYDSTEGLPCHLHVDLLLNCPHWTSYAQFVYSTTGIPSLPEAAKRFGANYLGEPEADSWREYLWTNSSKTSSMLCKAEFCAWMHNLLLLTVLPPEGDCEETLRVNYPNSVAAFVHVSAHFVIKLGYPIHWVSCFLDDILATSTNKLFKTQASVPANNPPIPNSIASKAQKLDLSAFLMDLRTQLGLCFQRHQLLPSTKPFLPLEALLSVPYQKYEIAIPGRLSFYGFKRQNPQAQCMALLLEPNKPFDDGNGDGNEDNFMAMMFGDMFGGGVDRKSIRNDILSKGSKNFHVISCLEWELIDFGESNRLRFCMSRQDFEKLQYHYASLLRTDGWFRVGKPIQLRKAKAVY